MRSSAPGSLSRLAPPPRVVLIDVGFTLTSCDPARVCAHAAAAGLELEPDALLGAEPRLRAEMREAIGTAFGPSDVAAPSNWGQRFFRRMLELAGAPALDGVLDRAAEIIWTGHLESNLWCRVADGVPGALERMRSAGMRLAVVSNSEGTVEQMLVEVGLRHHFETVVDSWVVGVAKPDPRIFHLALERLGAAPEEAIMVGDSPRADVGGARAAGVRAALLDPLGLYPSVEVPRFPDLAAFAEALLGSEDAASPRREGQAGGP